MGRLDFKNKVVVVTGSTQGIGKRTAELLGKRGAVVVINSRNIEKVQRVVEEFQKEDIKAFGVPGDISDYSFCEDLKTQIINQFGRIDYLINNAGAASKGTLLDCNISAFENLYRVNVFGSLYPTKVLLPEIIKTKGGVLFISSLAGIIGLPSYMAYSGTKRSITSLAESLKNETQETGVFIGVNYPGFTENDIDKKIILPTGKEEILPKREGIKVGKLDNTVSSIIRQIERRKFTAYSSIGGRITRILYGIAPSLSIYILKINRNKIMKMD